MTTENDANDPKRTDTPTHFLYRNPKKEWDAGLYIIKLGSLDVGAVWVSMADLPNGIDAVEHWALFTTPPFVSPAQGGSLSYKFLRVEWSANVKTPETFKSEVLALWPDSAPKWSRATVEAF